MKLTLEEKRVAALRELAKHIPEDEDYMGYIDGKLYEIEHDKREETYTVYAGGSETRDPVMIGMIYPTRDELEVWTKQGWETYPVKG